MKLSETVDKCISYIEDQIKSYSFELNYFLKYDKGNTVSITELKSKLNEYQEHLKNLHSIKK